VASHLGNLLFLADLKVDLLGFLTKTKGEDMSYTEALESAGYKKEKSTAGEMPVYEGVYKATLTDVKEMEDKGYGTSIWGQFQIAECLGGQDFAVGRKLSEFYNTAPEKIGSKVNGLAKLLNGLFSAGTDANPDNLNDSLGADVYLNLYRKKKMKKEGDGFVEVEGEYKQGISFMTEKNALSKAKQIQSKDGAPF
jgi:hypothetical protein